MAQALICHHKAGEDACEHLKCIKLSGCCLKETGIEFRPPPFVVRIDLLLVPSPSHPPLPPSLLPSPYLTTYLPCLSNLPY